jgi:hypothetical protein
MLLIFNLMPIFPLDGGQLLQSMLWPKFGYYKSMNFSLITGIVGSILAIAYGLATGSMMMIVLFGFFLVGNINGRRQLLAEGPWGFQDEDGPDYSSSLFNTTTAAPKHKKLNKRVVRRAQKREADERAERERVDAILSKVSHEGMNSLTWWERRALRRATERQRKRDVDLKAEMTRKGF